VQTSHRGQASARAISRGGGRERDALILVSDFHGDLSFARVGQLLQPIERPLSVLFGERVEGLLNRISECIPRRFCPLAVLAQRGLRSQRGYR